MLLQTKLYFQKEKKQKQLNIKTTPPKTKPKEEPNCDLNSLYVFKGSLGAISLNLLTKQGDFWLDLCCAVVLL